MKKLLVCAALVGSLALPLHASAQSSDHAGGPNRIKLGTLSCHESAGWGFIFGASRQVHCTFTSGERVEYYDGSIGKFGLDVGYQKSGVLLWAVVAPTDHYGPDALSGHYGGLTVGATVGLGLDGDALIGGSTTTIALQPLSIEGTTGLNVAAGVADLTLRAHDHDHSNGM